MFSNVICTQFFSAALPQNGKDDEGFEGFLEKDVLKEIRRAARLVRPTVNFATVTQLFVDLGEEISMNF